MNRERWQRPEVPIAILALKLCEETGEVSNVITDHFMRGTVPLGRDDNVLEELDHVMFIATTLQERIRSGMVR